MFTDTAHPRGVAAKDFLWNKCNITIQRQILQDDIKNAAQLWTYLKKEVTVAARQSILSLQRELFNATLLHDESISEYSVTLQELRQQIALGGVATSEDQLIMHLVKDLPSKYERVSDEIQVRVDIFYRDAVALLTRADLRSKASSSRSSHSALAATRSAVPNFTISDDLYCQRRESSCHLASVCQALQPSPKAYAKYEKYILYKQPNGPKY